MSRFLARKGYQVVGQECVQDAIDLARANPMFIDQGDVSFECSDYEEMTYKDEFDAVVPQARLHGDQHPVRLQRCVGTAQGLVFLLHVVLRPAAHRPLILAG